MNVLHTRAKIALAASALVLTMAMSPGSFAATPDSATQRDRAETTLPGDRTPSTAEEARTQVDRTNQEAQGRADSQQPRQDVTDTPAQDACENSHAPTGAPSVAENDNQQINENAESSRAAGNQSAAGAENSRRELAQAGDDCLDVNSTIQENNEDARGQGTGSDANDRGAGEQTRTPQS